MRSRCVSIALALTIVGTTLVPGASAEPTTAPNPPDVRFGIAEGFRNPAVMSEIGPGWSRLVFGWDQIQPDRQGDFTRLGMTLPAATLQAELSRGTKIAGLLQFTPRWAAESTPADPNDIARTPPKNLNLPFDDPNNYWGQFVYETVKAYNGRINDWLLWNEPEFRKSDAGGGGSYTWTGTDQQFAQLVKVGYLAAKKANPNATVSFPGTSYWVEKLANREQFYSRILKILAADPDAAKFNYFHDVVSLNLYRAPDDMFRVYTEFKEIQAAVKVDKPIWLTETNAMPTNDSSIPCADKHAATFPKTTMDQQAAYALQSFAIAAGAGYQRIEFYQMVDSDTCREPAVWGVTRDNGSKRPVADALRTAIGYFSGYTKATFAPLVGQEDRLTVQSWPGDRTSFVTNWQVYQVAFDKPGGERVSALWNGDGTARTARIRKNGASAELVDRMGNVTPLQENQGWWVVDLPAATARGEVVVGGIKYTDPEGYYFIGGDPFLIVEKGVDPSAPVLPPRIGRPGEVAREFRVVITPPDQTVGRGQPAEFFLSTSAFEDFNDPINLRIASWSTQRFPEARDGGSFPLAPGYSATINPGDRAVIRLETAGQDGGIYFFTVEASGGGITKTVDLALVVS